MKIAFQIILPAFPLIFFFLKLKIQPDFAFCKKSFRKNLPEK